MQTNHNHIYPYYLFIGFLHLLGVTLLLLTSKDHPTFLGLGILAYTFGLRHAFDADHISAIDNTVRKLVQQKHNSYGVGFWFSLGHSTVVVAMSFILTISVKWATNHMPLFQQVGGLIGTIVSGSFLIAIAVVNGVVLAKLLQSLNNLKTGQSKIDGMEDLLISRGIISRLCRPLFKIVNKSSHMFPIGFLFGLGFDTATEISLLALTAQSSQHNTPIIGLLSLPILFTAGMSLLDTTDSVMMSNAYGWAFKTPLRKIYYNLTVTSISVIVAVLIGGLELLQLTKETFKLNGSFWSWIDGLDLNWMGIGIVIIFIVIWTIAYLIWRIIKNKNIDDKSLHA